jgi:hypothetical protein
MKRSWPYLFALSHDLFAKPIAAFADHALLTAYGEFAGHHRNLWQNQSAELSLAVRIECEIHSVH